MDNKLQKLDSDIYSFVINTVSFLKTLQKKGIQNAATTSLAKLTKSLNSKFNIFYEKPENQTEIKNVLTSLLEQIKFILIKNFEEEGMDIIHEKADLLIDADKLQAEIDEIL